MTPTYETSDNRGQLVAVLLGDYDGDDIYVFYPKDAVAEDLDTMWIRSPESETTRLRDQL